MTMQQLPNIETVSAMKHRYNEVMQRLDAGPIVLTRNAKPVGVLLSPAQWNALSNEQDALRAEVAALHAQIAARA